MRFRRGTSSLFFLLCLTTLTSSRFVIAEADAHNTSEEATAWIIGGGEAVVNDAEFNRARTEFDRLLSEINKFLNKKAGAMSASDLSAEILKSSFARASSGLEGKSTLELIQLYLSWAQDAAFRIAGTVGDQTLALGSVGQPETYYDRMRRLSEKANEVEKKNKPASLLAEDALRPADTSITKRKTSLAISGPTHMPSADEIMSREESNPISENSEKMRELKTKLEALLKASKASLSSDPQGTLARIEAESPELWSIYSGLNQDGGNLSEIDNQLRQLSDLQSQAQTLAREKFFEDDPAFGDDWRNLMAIRSRMKGDADYDSAVKWMKEAHAIEAKILKEMQRPPRRPFPEYEKYLSSVVKEIEKDFEAITGEQPEIRLIPDPSPTKPGSAYFGLIPDDWVDSIGSWFNGGGSQMPSGGPSKGDGGGDISGTPSGPTTASGVSPIQHETQTQPKDSVTNEDLANVFNSVKPDTTGSVPSAAGSPSLPTSPASGVASTSSPAASRGFGPEESLAGPSVGDRISALGPNGLNIPKAGTGGSGTDKSNSSIDSDRTTPSTKSRSSDSGDSEPTVAKNSRSRDDFGDEDTSARDDRRRAASRSDDTRSPSSSTTTSVPQVIPKSNPSSTPAENTVASGEVGKPVTTPVAQDPMAENANPSVRSIGRKSQVSSTPTYSLGGASIDSSGGVNWQPSVPGYQPSTSSNNSPGLYNPSVRNGGPGSVSPVTSGGATSVSYNDSSGVEGASRSPSSASDSAVNNALAGLKESGVSPQLASIDQTNPGATEGALTGLESLVERTIGRVGSFLGVTGKPKAGDLDDFLGAGASETVEGEGLVADPITGEQFDPTTGKLVAKPKAAKGQKAKNGPAPADLNLKKWLTYLYGI